MQTGNLFRDVPDASSAEVIEEFLAMPAAGARLERIVSHGQSSPRGFWYDQAWDEWVLILAGGATVRLEQGGPISLSPGDWLHIPAHARHRVDATLPETVWLAVHGGGPA